MAQKKLFSQYYAYVLSITLRYMSSCEEAEEMLNDTFLKVFDHLDRYDSKYPMKSWIRKITVNTCLDRIKALKTRMQFAALESWHLEEPDKFTFEFDESKPLLPIIQQLPPKYRAVFNLYVFEECKHREIAELLGISEGTSKSNYARAKKILKKSLQQDPTIMKGRLMIT